MTVINKNLKIIIIIIRKMIDQSIKIMNFLLFLFFFLRQCSVAALFPWVR